MYTTYICSTVHGLIKVAALYDKAHVYSDNPSEAGIAWPIMANMDTLVMLSLRFCIVYSHLSLHPQKWTAI